MLCWRNILVLLAQHILIEKVCNFFDNMPSI